MPIFTDNFDYRRFMKTALYYQLEGPKPRFSIFNPNPNIAPLENRANIVDIVCYCLMPNHFHFLLQQKKDEGITEFISKLSNSYTRYFNTKDNRVGPLFQGEFKSVYVETTEQLIHLSRYIHLNPLVGNITKDLETYNWSSYPEYLGKINDGVCSKNIVLDQFESVETYRQFVLDYEGYARELKMIKHQILDLKD